MGAKANWNSLTARFEGNRELLQLFLKHPSSLSERDRAFVRGLGMDSRDQAIIAFRFIEHPLSLMETAETVLHLEKERKIPRPERSIKNRFGHESARQRQEKVRLILKAYEEAVKSLGKEVAEFKPKEVSNADQIPDYLKTQIRDMVREKIERTRQPQQPRKIKTPIIYRHPLGLTSKDRGGWTSPLRAGFRL